MPEREARRPSPAERSNSGEPERKEKAGSHDHAAKEAVEKNGRSADPVMRPGANPDPGIQEDYGKRSGQVPSEEPGNPKNG